MTGGTGGAIVRFLNVLIIILIITVFLLPFQVSAANVLQTKFITVPDFDKVHQALDYVTGVMVASGGDFWIADRTPNAIAHNWWGGGKTEGIIDMGLKKFDEVAEAPAVGYQTDVVVQEGHTYVTSSPEKGMYGKFYIDDIVRPGDRPGLTVTEFSIRYTYQPDGSRNLVTSAAVSPPVTPPVVVPPPSTGGSTAGTVLPGNGLYENYRGSPDIGGDVRMNYWHGQTFTTLANHQVSSVKLLAYRIGNPGTLIVSLRAVNSSGHPTGSDLASGSTSGDTLPLSQSGEWREITFYPPVNLTAGTKYAIVARAPGGGGGNAVRWQTDSTAPDYTGGNRESSGDSGANWQSDFNSDYLFEILGPLQGSTQAGNVTGTGGGAGGILPPVTGGTTSTGTVQPPVNIPTGQQGSVKWKLKLNELGFDLANPAIGPDGTIYVSMAVGAAYSSGILYAVDPAGTKKWEYKPGSTIGDPIVGDDGTIYVIAGSSIHAVTTAGTKKWEWKSDPYAGLCNLALGAGGTLYTGQCASGEYRRTVFAINPGGTTLWKFVPDCNTQAIAVGKNGEVYVFGSLSGVTKLTALSAANGSVLWTNTSIRTGSIRPGMAIGDDGTIYIASAGYSIYNSKTGIIAINPGNGIQKWEYALPDAPGIPCVGADGTVYTWAGTVYAISRDGQLKWKAGDFGASGYAYSIALAQDGTIYCLRFYGAADGNWSLTALDSAGALKWKVEVPDGGGSPAIGQDGTVYVAGGGNISAVQGASPLAPSSWPRATADNRNTRRIGTSPGTFTGTGSGTGTGTGTSTTTTTTTVTGTRLVAESRTASPGDTVLVPVRLEGAQGIGSLGFTISYNPAVIQYIKADKGAVMPADASFVPNSPQQGTVILAYATSGAINGSGTAAQLEFKATGTQGSQSALTLSEITATGSGGAQVGVSASNGQVTIGQKIKGDGTGDGQVTVLDALMALKMYVKALTENLVLDVNGDGKVTPEDARQILKMAKPK